MEMRVLGRSGVNISKFGFGSGMFGYFANSDQKECSAMVHKAIEAGINYFDCSDSYSYGEAETILGKALKGKRNDVVLATKFSLPFGDGPNQKGASRVWIHKAVDASLKRLNTDYIDLYQVHRPDASTDIDETLGALSDLVHSGKIRLLGSSTFPAEQIVEAQWASERRNRERFLVEQPPYSIFARRIEADVLPTCQRYGIGVVAWSPLSQGWLTGKWRRGSDAAGTNRDKLQPHLFDMSRSDNQLKLDLIEQLSAVAQEGGITLMHMALAFVCAHPAVTSAIIGPRTLEQLDGLLAGAEIILSEDILDAIDRIVHPGTTVSSDDQGYVAPEISITRMRRRDNVQDDYDPTGKILRAVAAYEERESNDKN
mgnify:CR=1 FL=1|tara:strand:+ start:2189 stop:3298 length:1110 start_codon:yes stop_codon:yes gene_type:complete